MKPRIVIDTNILVAAGFNPHSHAARIVQLIRSGKVELVWDESTLLETHAIIDKIPPLNWNHFADLYFPGGQFREPTNPAKFSIVIDPDDRKFAALASASGANLISNDDHLLSIRDQVAITIQTPEEWIRANH